MNFMYNSYSVGMMIIQNGTNCTTVSSRHLHEMRERERERDLREMREIRDMRDFRDDRGMSTGHKLSKHHRDRSRERRC